VFGCNFKIGRFDVRRGRWPEKKSPRGCRAINSSGTAGGDLPYGGCCGLAVFEFLKLVVPGAFFAKDFGVAVDLRAVGFSRLGIKDDIIALQLEITGFVRIIRVFDEKIQAAAYGTLHFQLLRCLVFGVWFSSRKKYPLSSLNKHLKNFR
jgi:hypothetical protein